MYRFVEKQTLVIKKPLRVNRPLVKVYIMNACVKQDLIEWIVIRVIVSRQFNSRIFIYSSSALDTFRYFIKVSRVMLSLPYFTLSSRFNYLVCPGVYN